MDSSLRKITSFLKKLKLLNENNKSSLLREVNSLNLSRFLSEAANALLDSPLSRTLVPDAIEVCICISVFIPISDLV